MLSLLVIRDWSLNSSSSHLAGGMTYSNGGVTVPIAERYYIYMQMYMGNRGRIFVIANSKAVIMIQPTGAHDGTVFAAGLFKLNAGDIIMVKVAPGWTATVYMSGRHCYFGAYLI